MYGHPQATHSQAAAMAPDFQSAAIALHLQGAGDVPEWIEMIPAGEFVGRDGRRFVNDNPSQVVAAFQTNKANLPFDVEHSSEHKAKKGEPAPAHGWIESVEVRNNAVWARVDWNDSGRDLLTARHYRYYSPVFFYDPDTLQVLALKSAGLTNQPNLEFSALNQQDSETHSNEDDLMKLTQAIAQALNVNTDATEESVLAAINTLKTERQTALNQAENPDTEKFIPIATHQAVLARATSAEEALTKDKADRLTADAETAVNQAVSEGKIKPADKDYHLSICTTEEGLAAFQELAKTLPVIDEPSGASKKPIDQAANTAGFKAPAGYEVDGDGAALHGKAVAYQQEHKCDYIAAVKAVGG